jgi:L,D-peptidoglycan transpeptidase YkuD (ErfK/YbiS/YcfS/YnhG family)
MAVFARSVPDILAAFVLAATTLMGSDTSLMVVHRRDAGTWILEWRGKSYRCAVGKNGIAKEGEKREGDGKTPSGVFTLRGLYFRPDKVDPARLPLSLAPMPLTTSDGWCDEPGDPNYNRFVKLPYAARHEVLWRRNDDLYDLIIPLSYNDQPVVPGLGSAIFLHVARPDYAPTAGCVALAKQDLLDVLRSAGADARMRIDSESHITGESITK